MDFDLVEHVGNGYHRRYRVAACHVVGIVSVFSYFPQGIPVKLFVNLQNSGLQSVYVLVWILLLLTLPLPVLVLHFIGPRVGRTWPRVSCTTKPVPV